MTELQFIKHQLGVLLLGSPERKSVAVARECATCVQHTSSYHSINNKSLAGFSECIMFLSALVNHVLRHRLMDVHAAEYVRGLLADYPVKTGILDPN